MSKYLVINFNRYDTEKSTHEHIEANSPKDAILTSVEKSYSPSCNPDNVADELASFESYLDEDIKHVDEIFTCVPGEESDWLVYLV